MKKRIYSLVLLSVALLLVLGTGLQDPGLTGAAPGVADDDGNYAWDNPGSLNLTKTAEPVEGTANRWRVTLTLEGKDLQAETSSDIVLVIDTSGSMKEKKNNVTRMEAAQSAAKKFVNTLLGAGGSTQIAVVSFATDVTVHNQTSPFKGYSEKGSLISAIDGLKADGGTFTQAGLRRARLLLQNSTADNRYIVLLSDGEPTYSYGFTNTVATSAAYFTQSGSNWYARDDLAMTAYGTARVGGGSSMTTKYKSVVVGYEWIFIPVYHDYYYHHGHSAIAESRFAWAENITVYSVGLEAGTDGQDILNRVAPGNSYAATESNLEAIFQNIAGSISLIAARDCRVTDPLGEMFSMVGAVSSVTVNRGEVDYDAGTKTLTWKEFSVSEGHPATMSYIVELDNPAAVSGVLYPTNKTTYVNYLNILDDEATKYFPIPQAGIEAAGIIKITKEVQDDDGSGKRFPIYVEGAEGRTWSALLADGETATFTGLGTGTYTIREVVPMGYRFVDISQPEVTFTVEDPKVTHEVVVTNKKVDEPWFWDEVEKTNTFSVSASLH